MALKLFNSGKVKALETRINELEIQSRTWDKDLQGYINDMSSGDNTPVNQKNSMKFTGVLAAVSLRSVLMASFPKSILKISKDFKEEIPDDPLYKLIAYQPNQFMNAFTFWELINTHLDLWGNSYAFITRYRGVPIDLTPVHPSFVSVLIEGGKLIYRVKGCGNDKIEGDHSHTKFLHFKDISFDGYTGISRIEYAKKAIELGLEAQAFGLNFFTKKGNAKGVIEMDLGMTPEAMKNFKVHWDANADQGTPILDNGKKYHQLTIPPEDAQFLQSRQFQIQDIARIFNVPPHLLGDLSRATFSNVEQAFQEFITVSVRPMVKRYEAELEVKLLGADLGKKAIRFNLDGMMRGDSAARAAYFAALKQNKLYSTNEIRKMNGDNPSADPSADKLENPATSSGANDTNETSETDE